jgi:hypothetical protein
MLASDRRVRDGRCHIAQDNERLVPSLPAFAVAYVTRSLSATVIAGCRHSSFGVISVGATFGALSGGSTIGVHPLDSIRAEAQAGSRTDFVTFDPALRHSFHSATAIEGSLARW